MTGRLFRPRVYTPPEPKWDDTIYPIRDMLRELAALDDSAWAEYAFSHDILKDKLSAENKQELMLQAVCCGEEAALRLTEEYEERNPSNLAEKLDVTVIRSGEARSSSVRVLFAKYTEPDTITIFTENTEKCEALFKGDDCRDIFGGLDVFPVLLGHELFHVLEYRQGSELWCKTYEMLLWKLGPIKYRSKIGALSEISAMAFARRLTGLPFTPYLLDVALMYLYSKPAACRLYEKITRTAFK